MNALSPTARRQMLLNNNHQRTTRLLDQTRRQTLNSRNERNILNQENAKKKKQKLNDINVPDENKPITDTMELHDNRFEITQKKEIIESNIGTSCIYNAENF
jgi:hypothetical protein